MSELYDLNYASTNLFFKIIKWKKKRIPFRKIMVFIITINIWCRPPSPPPHKTIGVIIFVKFN